MDVSIELQAKDREAFEASLEEMKIHNLRVGTIFDTEKNEYFPSDVLHPSEDHIVGWINFSWKIWQEKAVPDGFISIPEENLAIFDVFAERKRQIEQEQYSPEHDDEYDQNELIRAASSYLNHVVGRRWVCESKSFGVDVYQSEEAPDLWPWEPDFWKPKDPRRDLVRAAALIIAEIEKIDRNIEREAVS